MRGPFLALLLVLSSLLSGCIFAMPEEAPPEVLPAIPWEALLRAPAGGTHDGVLGFWVPENATDLLVHWSWAARNMTVDGQPAEPSAKDLPHAEGPRGPLGHFTDLLVVLDPDGTRRYVGSPTVRHLADEGVTGQPRSIVLDDPRPRPGGYLLALFGHLPPPEVRYTVPEGMRIIDLTPLPLEIERVPLIVPDGPVPQLLDGSGTWTPPERTVAVWGSLEGTGVSARLTLQDPGAAAPAFVQERRIMAAPHHTGLQWFTFGADQVLERWQADPAALTAGTLEWQVEGTGTGVAYAYAAVAGSLDAPIGRSRDAEAATAEVTPIEGPIASSRAGHLVLPDGAALSLHLSESRQSGTDHARYRIYDVTGTRLAWGSTTNETAPLALPAGPLAILNDGPGALEVQVHGPAPSDATLHTLPIKPHTLEAALGETSGGADDTTIRAILSGPALSVKVDQLGTLSGVHVEVRDQARVQRATLPHLDDRHPRDSFCCPFPVFGGLAGDAHWIDAGEHHVRFSSTDGEGRLFFSLDLVDLTPLTEPDLNGN